jgi:hypothetical protein
MTYRTASIYEGRVSHLRLRPKRHRLDYRVFSLLIDLDEMERIARGVRVLSVNRFNIFSLWTRDHGDGSEEALKDQLRALLERMGLEDATASIQMLCYPRILGYVFNPLTVFYCRGETGDLRAIVYEVHNTFGERHSYIFRAEAGSGSTISQSCAKKFYVSPFIPMEAHYHFRLTNPGNGISVAISESDKEGTLLEAAFVGTASPLSNRTLYRLFFAYPLMTFKVIAGIHWEALRLLFKRVPVFKHPATQRVGASFAHPVQEPQ